jgi:hypothetical protein
MKRFRKSISRIYLFLEANWWVSVLLYVVPAAFISAVKLLGKYIGMVDQATGDLTPLGLTATMASFSIIVLYSVIKGYVDYTFFQANKRGQELLQRVLRGINDAKAQKVRRFISYIEEYHDQPLRNPFPIITQPELQMEEILKEMQKTFVDIFGIAEYQIGLCVVCKLEGEDKWLVPARVNVGSKSHIKELIKERHSTFYPIANDQSHNIYIPSKQLAAARGDYKPVERDFFSGKMVGSVICEAVEIADTKRYVRGILAISTYGTELYVADDNDSARKIHLQILPPFIRRLQIELALLYIKTKMYQEN